MGSGSSIDSLPEMKATAQDFVDNCNAPGVRVRALRLLARVNKLQRNLVDKRITARAAEQETEDIALQLLALERARVEDEADTEDEPAPEAPPSPEPEPVVEEKTPTPEPSPVPSPEPVAQPPRSPHPTVDSKVPRTEARRRLLESVRGPLTRSRATANRISSKNDVPGPVPGPKQ